MNKGKFAIGALVGAAAGLIAAVLTAPKSGKQTRADIKDKAAELKADAIKKSDELTTKSNEVIQDAKSKLDEIKKDFTHKDK